MNNTILRAGVLGALATSAALLAACMGSDTSNSGSGSGRVEVSATSKVLAYDADSALLVLESSNYYCDSTTLEQSTPYVDSARYQVAGGKLKIWDDGSCYTRFNLSGSSSTIIGRWTGTEASGFVDLVPLAYRPGGCSPLDELPINTITLLFNNLNLTVDVTEQTLRQTVKGEFCFARFLGLSISGDTTGMMNGCTSMTYTDSATGGKATLTGRLVGDQRLEATFSYAGTVCQLRTENPFFTPDSNTVCKVYDDFNESSFMSCVESTNFFETSMLLKRGPGFIKEGLRSLARQVGGAP